MAVAEQLRAFWLGPSRGSRWGRALILAVVIPLVAAILGEMRFLRVVELKTEDLRFRWRGEGPIHPDLIIVEIDELTIEKYGGQFPLPRSQHALLLRGLAEAGASIVGFDFLFSTPSAQRSDDLLLSYLMGQYASHVVLSAHFREAARPGERLAPSETAPELPDSMAIPGRLAGVYRGRAIDLPHDPYLRSGAGLGHVTLLEDLEVDGSIRRVPLFLRYGERLVPAFGLVCWLRHLGETVADLRVDERERLVGKEGPLLDLPPRALHEIDYAGDTRVFEGSRISYVDALVLFRSAEEESATAELRDDIRARFEGKVVLVGLTAKSSYSVDLGITPFSSSTPLLYTHANLVNDLLLERGVRRSPATLTLLAAALLLLVGAGVGPQLKPAIWLWLALLVMVATFLAAQMLFTAASIMVDLVPPMLALALGYLTAAVLAFFGQERERQIVRRTFDRYVSPDLLEGILANAGRIELGGTLETVTVVFVDIRGFTAWTRSLEPRQLVDELNALLGEMVDVIFAAGGSVNKFLGDAILAIFGAPIGYPDDTERAVRAAGELRSRLAEHNRRRHQEGKPSIRLGIGIASGPVVAGNVGSSRRLEFTVIGNAVNLASRLQSLSRDGQILMDEETRRRLGEAADGLGLRPLGPTRLKGIDDPVEVFEITAAAGRAG